MISMALSREIIIIVVLLFLAIVLVKAFELFTSPPLEADASKFVIEDLKTKYSNSEVEIIAIDPKSNPKGDKYFEVKAKVVTNSLTPCPERLHIYYNYPVQNFAQQPTEVITNNCQVCSNSGELCKILFPEEAIIGSHTLSGTTDVNDFLGAFPQSIPDVLYSNDSWSVSWNSNQSKFGYLVVLKTDGTVAKVEKTTKP